MLSHRRHANGQRWPAYSGTGILLLTKLKRKEKKKRNQSWTPSDKYFWIRAELYC